QLALSCELREQALPELEGRDTRRNIPLLDAEMRDEPPRGALVAVELGHQADQLLRRWTCDREGKLIEESRRGFQQLQRFRLRGWRRGVRRLLDLRGGARRQAVQVRIPEPQRGSSPRFVVAALGENAQADAAGEKGDDADPEAHRVDVGRKARLG